MLLRYTFFFIALIGLGSATATAQESEYEAASRSAVTAVSLPQGANRVLPEHVPAEVDQTLNTIVAQGGGKLSRLATEVLVWTGSELKRNGEKAIINRLSDTLKASGWTFEASGTENGITFFTVLFARAEKRALAGFHGVVDDTLVLAWTELKASQGGPTAASPGPAKSQSVSVSGSVADYEFTTPAGWVRKDSADKIILNRGEDNMIAFLDAERILWQVLKGHKTWHGNGFQPDYGTFERGKTSQGLEYFQAYRYAKKASDPNEGFVSSRFDAIILLVNIGGGKVAVVVGTQPFQSTYARDSTLSAIDLILYDLKFRSVTAEHNLKREILGSWSAASSTVALAYTFNANGSFSKGAAHEFRTSRDRYTDNVTTTSYGLTETYSLAGNILTQNYKRTGQVIKHKVRVYQTKYDKDPWKLKLGFLPLADNPNGETIVLSRSGQ
jgi:hypothetical protein